MRTRPGTTVRSNATTGYWCDVVLYTRTYTSEHARRAAVAVWVNHYDVHRHHSACREQPPASRTPARVNNVMPSHNEIRCTRSIQ